MKIKKNILMTPILAIGLMLSTSCGKGSSSNMTVPGVNGPTLTLTKDSLLIDMTFTSLTLEGGARVVPVKKYPNSYIELGPDLQSNGTLMSINVAIKDVLNMDTTTLDPMTLPGGRSIPGIQGGSLPAVAFNIPKFKNMSFYLGPKVFGVFIPLPKVDLQGSIITAKFYSAGKRLGNMSLVGQDSNGQNAGMLLLIDLGNSVKNRLRRFIR